MRRPVFLGTDPLIRNVYKKDAATLFSNTGGNTGNLAFLYATLSHLEGRVPILPWGASPSEVRAAGDIIVLPLANQLGSHTNLRDAARWLTEFNLPIVATGLGAQADATSANIRLTAGTTEWLSTIARLSPTNEPNIGVRGPYTKALIERLGFQNTAAITGCPSNFINFDDPATRVAKGFTKKPTRIAVMAGIPFIPELAKIEQTLAQIVSNVDSAYIVQHGLEMLRLARDEFDLIDSDELELCRNYILPHATQEGFKAWCRNHAYAFYDPRSWMDFVTRFDFVVGTRFHGAMLALQAGVPAACITHDSRTQEMCETMGVPHCSYRNFNGRITEHNIMDYFSFDPDVYRERRKELLRKYLKVYQDAEISVDKSLFEILRLRPH